MASVNDKGPFTPAGLSPRVRVSSADTTADFLDNKVVEGTRVGTEVLNPAANEQLQLSISTVGGVWVGHSQVHTGSVSFGTGAPFMALGGPISANSYTTFDAAKIRVPRAVTVTSLFFVIGTALTAGQTVTARWRINDVAQPDLQVVIDDTTTVDTGVGVFGELLIDQDDDVCIEFVYGGGATAIEVRSWSAGYLVAPEP